MGLMAEVAAATRKVDKCKFGRWLDDLDPKYRAEIEEVLVADFPSNTIWRVLFSKDPSMSSAQVFVKHREGRCVCVAER